MDLNISTLYDRFFASKTKIRFFFAASFVIFAVVISGIAFFINYQYETKYLVQSIQHNAKSYIQNKQIYLQNQIDHHKNNIVAISKNQILLDYVNTNVNKQYVVNLFEQMMQSDEQIMQLRFIDANGNEKIRLDRAELGSDYRVVPDRLLQNKKDRYYFKEASKLNDPNEVWISDVDLNIENNKIEIPIVPTMRFAVSLHNETQFKGILVINIFMKNILQNLTNSDNFLVSIIDQDGHYLIGKRELQDGKVIDCSWSQYMVNQKNPKQFDLQILETIAQSDIYLGETLFAKNLSTSLDLLQQLTIVLEVKKSYITSIQTSTFEKLFETLLLVVLLSGPVGLLLSLIPSGLASKYIKASGDLKNKSLIFDEYLETMNMNNIISKSDLKGNITYVNQNFCDVSGYTKEELLGKPHSLLRHPSTPNETFKILWLTIQSGNVWSGMLRNKRKDGGHYDVDQVIMPIKDTNGKIIEYLAVRHDITELIEQRKNLFTLASTDQLTQVGNRYKLSNDIAEHMVNNVAVIDIDKFSNINDLYGNEIGDHIIKEFAKLLEENLTDEFTLYRLHGDKFAILNYTLDSDRFSNFIEHLNKKMIESVIVTDIKDFDIVTTVGISSQENSIILTTAEMANRYAKSVGKKVFKYSKELNLEKKFEENIQRTEQIKLALIENRFEVYFQPIFNNTNYRIEKYECLVRMIDIDGQVISPFFFLDIAKSTGQYIDITKIVIQKSFEKFKDTDREFSINLTIEDILNDELVIYLEEMIHEYNINKQLVLEIVESEGIENFDLIQKFIKRLKAFGVQIAIDDFGTGYSNFEYLIKLQPDYVKIDGSLIKDIKTDPNMYAIVTTIVQFAKRMNYKVIAEFVSSEEIFEAIKEIDIDYSQGFYIGKPEPELIEN